MTNRPVAANRWYHSDVWARSLLYDAIANGLPKPASQAPLYLNLHRFFHVGSTVEHSPLPDFVCRCESSSVPPDFLSLAPSRSQRQGVKSQQGRGARFHASRGGDQAELPPSVYLIPPLPRISLLHIHTLPRHTLSASLHGRPAVDAAFLCCTLHTSHPLTTLSGLSASSAG